MTMPRCELIVAGLFGVSFRVFLFFLFFFFAYCRIGLGAWAVKWVVGLMSVVLLLIALGSLSLRASSS